MVILDCELRDPPWITLERNYIKTGPVTALKKWAQFSYELSENSNEFDPISPGSNSFPEDYTVKSAECIFAMDPFPIEIPHQMFHLGSLKLGVHSNESMTSKFSSNQIISLFFFFGLFGSYLIRFTTGSIKSIQFSSAAFASRTLGEFPIESAKVPRHFSPIQSNWYKYCTRTVN